MSRKKSSLTTGNLKLPKDPRVYAKTLPKLPIEYRRVLGIDLGTNCGMAFCDMVPGQIPDGIKICGGIWDLSLGPYDSGALRHIRLKQYLAVSKPSVIVYEDVKFTPPQELVAARKMSPQAIVARVAGAAEFLGGLKMTLCTWAEENDIPAHGLGITHIKKFLTGSGVAKKQDMIRACNDRFGTVLDAEEYTRTGDDNIADAIALCAMGVDMYGEAL